MESLRFPYMVMEPLRFHLMRAEPLRSPVAGENAWQCAARAVSN